MIHVPHEQELEFLKQIIDTQQYRISQVPDTKKYYQEVKAYIDLLRSLGVTVYTDENVVDQCNTISANYKHLLNTLPNFIFLRDTALVSNDTLIFSSFRYKARSNHEAYKLHLMLNYHGFYNQMNEIKDLSFQEKNQFIEGADFFKAGDHAYLSTGNRTSKGIKRSLSIDDDHIIEIPAHEEGVPQHLLGCKHIVAEDLLISRSEINSHMLGFKQNEIIHLEENEETRDNYSMNIVTIAPYEIIMPSGNPQTKQVFENNGITVHETKTHEIQKLQGSLACMTLPICRLNQKT
jgi:N-dimethylarginine dimethylaminohydrolase